MSTSATADTASETAAGSRFSRSDIAALRELDNTTNIRYIAGTWLVIGVTVGETTLGTTIANLGMTDVRFANPVFHGDTVHVVTKVKEMRESKSRPNAGLVVFEHIGYNQRDEEVAYCVRTAFMRKKSA